MILGILIGIISYSLILTIINIYKDHSGYFELTMLDVIMSGPVTWFYFLCSFLFEFLILSLKKLGILKKKEHSYSYKKKSPKVIKKIMTRIMKHYLKKQKKRKKSNKTLETELFNLNSHSGDEWYQYNGWESLMIRKASHEWLNDKFTSIMWHQRQDGILCLEEWFEKVSDEELKEIFDWNYEDVKQRTKNGLWKLKKECYNE